MAAKVALRASAVAAYKVKSAVSEIALSKLNMPKEAPTPVKVEVAPSPEPIIEQKPIRQIQKIVVPRRRRHVFRPKKVFPPAPFSGRKKLVSKNRSYHRKPQAPPTPAFISIDAWHEHEQQQQSYQLQSQSFRPNSDFPSLKKGGSTICDQHGFVLTHSFLTTGFTGKLGEKSSLSLSWHDTLKRPPPHGGRREQSSHVAGTASQRTRPFGIPKLLRAFEAPVNRRLHPPLPQYSLRDESQPAHRNKFASDPLPPPIPQPTRPHAKLSAEAAGILTCSHKWAETGGSTLKTGAHCGSAAHKERMCIQGINPQARFPVMTGNWSLSV